MVRSATKGSQTNGKNALHTAVYAFRLRHESVCRSGTNLFLSDSIEANSGEFLFETETLHAICCMCHAPGGIQHDLTRSVLLETQYAVEDSLRKSRISAGGVRNCFEGELVYLVAQHEFLSRFQARVAEFDNDRFVKSIATMHRWCVENEQETLDYFTDYWNARRSAAQTPSSAILLDAVSRGIASISRRPKSEVVHRVFEATREEVSRLLGFRAVNNLTEYSLEHSFAIVYMSHWFRDKMISLLYNQQMFGMIDRRVRHFHEIRILNSARP